MKNSKNKVLNFIHLNDYKPFDYSIPSIKLNIIINKINVKIISEILLIKENISTNNISLKGRDIKINEDEPLLYELLPNGKYISHECILKN